MSHSIKYYSTNLKAEKVSFGDALLKGLAPDGGLYMPDTYPLLSEGELKYFSGRPYHEIAFTVADKFLHGEVPAPDLRAITSDAYNFPVPVERVYEKKHILRLDRGPTASFKDFAARLMGRLMQHFLQRGNKELLILTATSGDTGSAIANAFYGLHNIKVVVLFPEQEVTPRQRKQMTTLHKNISIVALSGKFDDCQAMVKKAFSDPELEYLNLSSANSINIGRLIPQSIYYIYAFSHLSVGDPGDRIIFSVPSGNFGDLMGGLIAMKMGLPVKRFVVSTNANDEVPVYLNTGKYAVIDPSLNCISSAMNVGHPSNMARIISLYGGIMNEKGTITLEPDTKKMQNDMFGISISDGLTKKTIWDVWDSYGVMLEPHGAVGWAGLMHYLAENPADRDANQLCVSLETAHPAKFPEAVRDLLGIEPDLPGSMAGLEEKEEKYAQLENNYSLFKTFLKDNYDH